MKTKLPLLFFVSFLLFIIFSFLTINFSGCNKKYTSQDTDKNQKDENLSPDSIKMKMSKNLFDTIKTNVKENLNAVSFINPIHGVIVGDSGTIIYTKNAGYKWNPANIPIIASSSNLYGVTMIDIHTAIAVGEKGLILRSTNGGVNWVIIVKSDSLFSKSLRSIAFKTKKIGYAVGDSGVIFRTFNAGMNWKKIYGDPKLNLNSLSYTNSSSDIAYVVGNAGKILDISIKNDTVSKVDAISKENLNCIHFGLTTKLFNHSDTGFVVGESGTTLRTTDGGKKWVPMISGTSKNLRGVFLLSSHWGYAVGDSGTILRYDGKKWTLLPQATLKRLNAVDPLWQYTDLCVGEGGTIYSINPPPVINGSSLELSPIDCNSMNMNLYLKSLSETSHSESGTETVINYTHFEICSNVPITEVQYSPPGMPTCGWATQEVPNTYFIRSNPLALLTAPPPYKLEDWQFNVQETGPDFGARIISGYLLDESLNPHLLNSFQICPFP